MGQTPKESSSRSSLSLSDKEEEKINKKGEKQSRHELHIDGRWAREMHPSHVRTHTITEMHKIQSQMGQMVAESEL